MVAPEDDRFLNDVYLEDQLPAFRLKARPRAPRRDMMIWSWYGVEIVCDVFGSVFINI